MDETARESAELSTRIGLQRARKALASTLELWSTSPPDDRRWVSTFRAWLEEIRRAER